MDYQIGKYILGKITTKNVTQELFVALGIYYAFIGVTAKLFSICKLINSAFFLKIFAQSLYVGFESGMLQVIHDEGADLTRLQSTPAEPAPLQVIHEKVGHSLLARGAGFLSDAFNAALKERLSALDAAEKKLVGVADGRDFIDVPTKNEGAFMRRFKAFYTGPYSRKNLPQVQGTAANIDAFNYASYFFMESIPAYTCALSSTILITANALGRFLGKEIARLTISTCRYTGIGAGGPKGVYYAGKTILFALSCYLETMEMVTTFAPQYLIDMAYGALYYPVISGAMIGIYETLHKRFPDAFKDFKAEPQATGPSIWTKAGLIHLFVQSEESARKRLERFDRDLMPVEPQPDTATLTTSSQNTDSIPSMPNEMRMYRALVHNFSSSKRCLESRYMLLSLLNKNTYLKENMLPWFLKTKALALSCQIFVSYLSFTVTKNTILAAAAAVESPIEFVQYLRTSIAKLLQPKPKDRPEVNIDEDAHNTLS